MTTRTRTQTAVSARDDAPNDASVAEAPVCSICFDVIDPKASVTLHCSHVFHGQCVTKALQRNPRCPLCRQRPSDLDGDDDEDEVHRAQDLVFTRVLRRLSAPALKRVLGEFDASVERASKRVLAEEVAIQLTCETDSEYGEEDEEEQ